MFVDDMREYRIGTLECRLSSEPSEYMLNSRERSGSACIFKPCDICSRVRRILLGAFSLQDTHYLRLRGTVLF